MIGLETNVHAKMLTEMYREPSGTHRAVVDHRRL
jgi:hypothetical protein